MNKEAAEYFVHQISPYDGYRDEPIWRQKENYSTYYDYLIDNQVTVPIYRPEGIQTND